MEKTRGYHVHHRMGRVDAYERYSHDISAVRSAVATWVTEASSLARVLPAVPMSIVDEILRTNGVSRSTTNNRESRVVAV
jgi:hypothetical protein